MTLPLERLVYESAATGTTESVLNLAVILAESQRNNDQRGLTGALAAHRERYVQVIEGPVAALDSLLRRLTDDPRHRHIRVLDRRAIAERQFEGWSMASPRFNPQMSEALDRLMAEPDPSGGLIVRLLREALDADRTLAA
ncbi:BLUF domain-containing protein [Brevundimonas sp.]|uniref:BLUF domain-containing protein n=1 Tax=Brevundimonas sp. TaxID=1871086 RepID=UPI003BAA5AC2